MRTVESPGNFPGRCFVTAKDEHPKGFVDFESAFDGAHLYLCHDIVEAAAVEIGLPSTAETDELRDQRDQLAAKNLELSVQVSELQAFKDAIHVIQSAGFKPQKKRGPKPQESK